MKTDSLVRNARVLIRADSIIADIHMRAIIARAALHVVAGLIAVFGIVMLGIAAFVAIEARTGAVNAALIVGGGALVLALLIVAIATRFRPGRDLEVAHRLHDSATEALAADLRSLEAEVRGLAGAVRHPFDGALPSLLLPLATMLIKSLRSKPAADAAE
jgi:hypothetical protein